MTETRRRSGENAFSKARENIVIPNQHTEKPLKIENEQSKDVEQINIPKKQLKSQNKPHSDSQKVNNKSSLDNLFIGKGKTDRGIAHSVYFRKDVSEFCNKQCEKYNVSFSDVVNLLIQQIMKGE